MTPEQRLRILIAYSIAKEIANDQKDLADKLGFSPVQISNVLNGKSELSPRLLKALKKLIPEMHDKWLEKGEAPFVFDSEFYVIKYVEEKDRGNIKQVELVNNKFPVNPLGVGNIKGLANSRKIWVELEEVEGNNIVYELQDRSMEDGHYSIFEHSKVLMSEVNFKQNKNLPIHDNLFLIVTHDRLLFRQIIDLNNEEGNIVCHAFNENFSDIKIDYNDIKQLFIYKKIISTRPPIPAIS